MSRDIVEGATNRIDLLSDLYQNKGSKMLTFTMHLHFASVFADYGIPPNPNVMYQNSFASQQGLLFPIQTSIGTILSSFSSLQGRIIRGLSNVRSTVSFLIGQPLTPHKYVDQFIFIDQLPIPILVCALRFVRAIS